MELKKQYENVMCKVVNMALATSTDNMPNVRIVSFAYDVTTPGKVYFYTFKGSQKVSEFAKNSSVCCMPLPLGAADDVQIRIFGQIQPSDIGMDKLYRLISQKYPEGTETPPADDSMIKIFEICFDKALITLGMEPPKTLSF